MAGANYAPNGGPSTSCGWLHDSEMMADLLDESLESNILFNDNNETNVCSERYTHLLVALSAERKEREKLARVVQGLEQKARIN